MDVLVELGDSVRNSAMGLRITLPSIGGLKKIRGHRAALRHEPDYIAAVYWRRNRIRGPGRNSVLKPRVTMSKSGGLNRTVGFRGYLRLEFVGNYPDFGGIRQIRGPRR